MGQGESKEKQFFIDIIKHTLKEKGIETSIGQLTAFLKFFQVSNVLLDSVESLPLGSQMEAAKAEEASMGMLETDLTMPDYLQEVEIGKKLQGKCLRIISPESPAKLYCSYAVIAVLTAAVIALSVTLSLSVKTSIESPGSYYATCPKNWIGFGSKCFYFSEDMRNWTFSQTSCMAQEAHLALFDSLEELNFLKRYKGNSDHWIGLHRESPEHPWRWTNNTEYNNLVLTQGGGECAYLNESGIGSARDYTHKKWICSKSNRYTLQCPEILDPG